MANMDLSIFQEVYHVQSDLGTLQIPRGMISSNTYRSYDSWQTEPMIAGGTIRSSEGVNGSKPY